MESSGKLKFVQATKAQTDEERYGNHTPSSMRLARKLQNYFEEFATNVRGNFGKLDKDNQLRLEGALTLLEKELFNIARVVGVEPIEEKFGKIYTIMSCVITQSFIAGAIIGDVQGHLKAKKPNREGGSKGGRNSVAARIAWHATATELAYAMREKFPSSSQDVLAQRIRRSWPKGSPPLPGHDRQITELISALEKSGLPRRRLEVKPLKRTH